MKRSAKMSKKEWPVTRKDVMMWYCLGNLAKKVCSGTENNPWCQMMVMG